MEAASRRCGASSRGRVEENRDCQQCSRHGARQDLARPADTGRARPRHRHRWPLRSSFRPAAQRGPPRPRPLGPAPGRRCVGSGRARAQAAAAHGRRAAARARLCSKRQARRCAHGLDVSAAACGVFVTCAHGDRVVLAVCSFVSLTRARVRADVRAYAYACILLACGSLRCASVPCTHAYAPCLCTLVIDALAYVCAHV